MASRKNDPNSSKTAHVMNLLSRGRGNPPAAAKLPEAQAQPAPAAPPAAVPPADAPQPASPQPPVTEAPAHSSPMISIMKADADASATIRDALESALLEEELLSAPQKAEAEPEPQEPEPTAKEPAPQEIEPTVEEPVPQESEPAAEEPVPQEPEPTAEEPVPQEPEPPAAEPAQDFTLVNVMEFLVEESVDRYIKMFGLCSCPRCRADVVADALTNLIPKYVVMGRDETNPRLALYRSRYSAAVTAQILRACKVVMDDPRHH